MLISRYKTFLYRNYLYLKNICKTQTKYSLKHKETKIFQTTEKSKLHFCYSYVQRLIKSFLIFFSCSNFTGKSGIENLELYNTKVATLDQKFCIKLQSVKHIQAQLYEFVCECEYVCCLHTLNDENCVYTCVCMIKLLCLLQFY